MRKSWTAAPPEEEEALSDSERRDEDEVRRGMRKIDERLRRAHMRLQIAKHKAMNERLVERTIPKADEALYLTAKRTERAGLKAETAVTR